MAREKSRPWQASTFQSGSNTWHTVCGLAAEEAVATNLYLHAMGRCLYDAWCSGGFRYREYLSDPANPVPYRQRPISPTYPAGDWRTWEAGDQRFRGRAAGCATFVSAPLEKDLVVTGAGASLFA